MKTEATKKVVSALALTLMLAISGLAHAGGFNYTPAYIPATNEEGSQTGLFVAIATLREAGLDSFAPVAKQRNGAPHIMIPCLTLPNGDVIQIRYQESWEREDGAYEAVSLIQSDKSCTPQGWVRTFNGDIVAVVIPSYTLPDENTVYISADFFDEEADYLGFRSWAVRLAQ